MRVWLVTIGEPLPVDEGLRDRLHRTGCLGQFLADRGHEVTWWTSTFDHMRKRHWFDANTTVQVGEKHQIRLLHGCGYRSNVSLARFRDHRQVAAQFARMAAAETTQPDIIVAALPTIELCRESVEYGRPRGIPVVLDMRDMWPDIFVDVAPRPARPLARLLLTSLFRQARRAIAGATAVTGITEAFVDWGLKRGRRIRSNLDRAFPMGYVSAALPKDRLRAAEEFWDARGIRDDGRCWAAVFFGTIGRQFDMTTVLQAARRLLAAGKPVRFVLCGRGDRLEHYQKMAADLPNVEFPGWVDAAAIHVLMRRAAVGLDPLPDRYDFLASINNKAVEYLSAGLPVVSSPSRGVLAELLKCERCGQSYECGDSSALAEILLRLHDSPETLQAMSRSANSLFQNSFAAEMVYGQMEEHLRGITAIRAPATLLAKAA
jgi:glycosyltransferase involved in cell wall biosynthesis